MEQKPIIEYRRNMYGPGPLVPYRQNSLSPILDGGIQHNLRDHLAIIFKHKYKIAVLFIIGLMLAPLAYHIVPEFHPTLYQARSILLMKSGNEYNEPALGTRTPPIGFGRGQILSTEMMILRSRDLKQRIFSKLGIEKIYPDIVAHPPDGLPVQEAAIIEFDKNLHINEPRNSNFIEVSFANENPAIAAKVTNMLVGYYEEKRREVLSDPRAGFFLEEKLGEYRRKLNESAEKLETFRRTYGFFSFPKQMEFLLQKQLELENSLSEAQDEVRSLKQTLPMISKEPPITLQASDPSIDESSVDGVESKELQGLEDKLLQLRQREVELMGKYTDRNQFIINVRNEIKATQALIDKEKASSRKQEQSSSSSVNLGSTGYEQEKSSIEASISAANDKVAGLKKELADSQKQINDLGSQEKKLNELARENEHNEKYYKVYADKVEELRIAEDISRQQMPSVTVLQSAVPPAKPINKNFNILVFFVMGGVLGLAAGVGLAYLLELMSQGIRTPEGVEARLGVPVLATVPLGTLLD